MNFPGNTLIKNLRTSLFALNKKNAEKMLLYSGMSMDMDSPATPFYILVVKDMCVYRLNKEASRVKVDDDKQYLVVKFVNKLIEGVKLKDIIRSYRAINAFPINRNINGFREPLISYKYSKTIRSDVLNYRQSIDEEAVHPATCNCSNYDRMFIDSHHNHVFTGNLTIVRNSGLTNLLGKGLGFREPQPPNKTKAFESIVSALDSYSWDVNQVEQTYR